MRLPRKAKKASENVPSPEDTQEMFTSGQPLPEDPEETREYEAAEDTGPETELIEDEPETELIEDEESVETIEDEAWEGDEYEEWEEDEIEEGEPEAEAAEKPNRGDDLKVWMREFSARAQTIWKASLKRVGEIKLPRHEIDGQKVLAAGGILVVALMVGAGGYLIGKGSGDDLDTARLEGEFAGKQAGAVAGATRGYAAGFKKGRDIAFRKAYSASYKRNYRRAYEQAGMDPPKAEDIEVPKP